MKPLEPYERTYRIRDLPTYFGVSKSTIYRWLALDEFPQPVKVMGSMKFWTHVSLREFMEGLNE